MRRGNALAVWRLHAAVVALLFALQFVLPDYHHLMLARVMVLAVFAIGYNMLFGYVGPAQPRPCDVLRRRALRRRPHRRSISAAASPAGFLAGRRGGRRAGAGGRAGGAPDQRRRLHDRHHDVRAGVLPLDALFRRRGRAATRASCCRSRCAQLSHRRPAFRPRRSRPSATWRRCRSLRRRLR